MAYDICVLECGVHYLCVCFPVPDYWSAHIPGHALQSEEISFQSSWTGLRGKLVMIVYCSFLSQF